MTCWWMIIQEQPLQTISVCSIFHDDPSNACWGISIRNKNINRRGSPKIRPLGTINVHSTMFSIYLSGRGSNIAQEQIFIWISRFLIQFLGLQIPGAVSVVISKILWFDVAYRNSYWIFNLLYPLNIISEEKL